MESEGAPPRTIGRYAVRRLLGRGSMGVVFLAEDPVVGRKVALKTIALPSEIAAAERAQYEKRFVAEARAAGRLTHPTIVVVYDVGRDAASGTLYMALEYLRGKPLDQLTADGQPLAWREALRTIARVAEGLHHAHAAGIVHRDIKPANIMVTESGHPKILDFGVAKLPMAQLTSAGQSFGSPAYMSPEQAAGGALDARSDLFSLGAVLYELLTGQRAFGRGTMLQILARVRSEEPPPPSTRVAGLPSAVDAVVARVLAKDPAQRHPSGHALAEQIEALLAAAPAPLPPGADDFTDPGVESRLLDHDWDGSGDRLDPEATPRSGHSGGALPAGKRVSLVFVSGPRQGDVVAVEKPRLVLGRMPAPGVDVALDDPQVSRKHAQIECDGGVFLLRDLGSTNGTHVGEHPVRMCEIPPGTEFRMGHTQLMVVVADA